ncbi:hypothetical protein [Ureibacillus sp. GCM10028918]|uniref:hypothetical protein n=1 Tax=Ureibacillus sp. GCM10028918 TaxID=3273429 RepID=UPI0036166607
MDIQLLELKISLKELIKNLIFRVDDVCQNIKNNEEERLKFWLEDLSMLTEVTIILSQRNIVDFDMDLFNEKVELLLEKIGSQDFLFVEEILQFEIKPLLVYWDGCIAND